MKAYKIAVGVDASGHLVEGAVEAFDAWATGTFGSLPSRFVGAMIEVAASRGDRATRIAFLDLIEDMCPEWCDHPAGVEFFAGEAGVITPTSRARISAVWNGKRLEAAFPNGSAHRALELLRLLVRTVPEDLLPCIEVWEEHQPLNGPLAQHIAALEAEIDQYIAAQVAIAEGR